MFEITIKEIKTETKTVRGKWTTVGRRLVTDKDIEPSAYQHNADARNKMLNGGAVMFDLMGYAPDVEEDVASTSEIYTQRVSDLGPRSRHQSHQQNLITMPENQLAAKRKDIREVMEGMKGQFALALPKLVTVDRFLRVALTCVNKNPKLLQCTQESLLACLLDCAALGIEPDGRRAHLIPYGDKCTLIIDYKGIAELVRRSGEVADLHADIICENDDFDYLFGTGSFLKHKIDIRKPRGEVVGAYSYVKLKDGAESFDVMGVAEIELIRKRSRSGNNGPWVTDKAEMQKKTVFRRHSKWLPLSPELRDHLEKDDEPMTEQERFAAARPVNGIEFGEALPSASETSATEPEKKRGRPAKEKPVDAAEPAKPDAPPLATPIQGLRNLMKDANIEDGALLAHLYEEGLVAEGDTIAFLPNAKIKIVMDNWLNIVEKLKAEAA